MESDKPQRPVPGEVRMKAMRVHRYGGPEAMIPEEIPPPKPGEGETLVRLEAVGVNFIDIYQRMGLYPMPLPFTPGNEGAGTVAETGPGETEAAVGDRVAYAGASGSYAEFAVGPSSRLGKAPRGIGAETAAAGMLHGMSGALIS